MMGMKPIEFIGQMKSSKIYIEMSSEYSLEVINIDETCAKRMNTLLRVDSFKCILIDCFSFILIVSFEVYQKLVKKRFIDLE